MEMSELCSQRYGSRKHFGVGRPRRLWALYWAYTVYMRQDSEERSVQYYV